MLFGADGLISSITAFKLLAVLGFVLASALTLLTVARNGPDLRSQTNLRTGVKTTGLLTWLAVFYVPLAILPYAIALFLEYPPLLVLFLACVVAGGIAWRRYRAGHPKAKAKPAPELVQERQRILEAEPTYNPIPNGIPFADQQPARRTPTYVETPENTYSSPEIHHYPVDPNAYLTPFPTGYGPGYPGQQETTWGLDPGSSYWERPADVDADTPR